MMINTIERQRDGEPDQFDNSSAESGGDDDDGESKFSPNSKKSCRVCGDKAFSVNFNVITCESCKAFFRRNALKPKVSRTCWICNAVFPIVLYNANFCILVCAKI